jgi:hypothetical protein
MYHKSKNPNDFRPLSKEELQLLRKLLSIEFIGQQQLLQQLPDLLCKSVDNVGSLELKVQHGPDSPIDGLLVEATYSDSDGVNISILLHVRNHKLWFLEVYKGDGSSISLKPTAEQNLSFFTNHPLKKIGE